MVNLKMYVALYEILDDFVDQNGFKERKNNKILDDAKMHKPPSNMKIAN